MTLTEQKEKKILERDTMMKKNKLNPDEELRKRTDTTKALGYYMGYNYHCGVRNDFLKMECKVGKQCGSICIPKDSQCNQGVGGSGTGQKQKSLQTTGGKIRRGIAAAVRTVVAGPLAPRQAMREIKRAKKINALDKAYQEGKISKEDIDKLRQEEIEQAKQKREKMRQTRRKVGRVAIGAMAAGGAMIAGGNALKNRAKNQRTKRSAEVSQQTDERQQQRQQQRERVAAQQKRGV